MGRLTIQDIAVVLAEKSGLSKRDARQFVTSFFDVVQSGLQRDKLVKIKGLGTFKVIDVDARESVNVNTGERVLIDGHAKISFIPDAAMKELVNKPFSGFETVILNDGISFDDVAVEEEPETQNNTNEEETNETEVLAPEDAPAKIMPLTAETADSEEETVEESIADDTPAVENNPVEEKGPVEEEAPAEEEIPVKEEDPVEEKPSVEEKTPLEEKAPVEEKNDMEQPTEKKSSSWWLWLLMALVACVISFIMGYRLGFQNSSTVFAKLIKDVPPADTVIITKYDTIVVLQKDTMTSKTDTVEQKKQEVSVVPPVSSKPVEPASTKPASAKPATAKPVSSDYKKYEAMDARVRTGAYAITGVDHVEKVRPGDTVERIARRTLGADMSCYIEVLNGIKKDTPLREGQSIKIPKLILKKKLKNMENK